MDAGVDDGDAQGAGAERALTVDALTPPAGFRIVFPGDDPRRTSTTLPQPGPLRGKGGHTPGSVSAILTCDRGRAAGGWPVVHPGETTMPRNKDLKRLVRTRMKKTGEAYTTARAHVVKKPRRAPRAAATTTRPSAPSPARIPVPDPSEYAAIAGMSDDVLKEKTGCTWARWVGVLDYHKAAEMSHPDIVKLVNTKFKVGPWWGQMVTVGYERIKGLRARGQRRDGKYGAGKSRTYNVPVTTLFDAWADANVRKRWLDGAKVRVRTATSPKSMRLGWEDGTIVSVGFIAKGRSKSSVSLEHEKLPDKATADRMKQFWSDRLDALRDVLAAET